MTLLIFYYVLAIRCTRLPENPIVKNLQERYRTMKFSLRSAQICMTTYKKIYEEKLNVKNTDEREYNSALANYNSAERKYNTCKNNPDSNNLLNMKTEYDNAKTTKDRTLNKYRGSCISYNKAQREYDEAKRNLQQEERAMEYIIRELNNLGVTNL